jgi:hypothetical protein
VCTPNLTLEYRTERQLFGGSRPWAFLWLVILIGMAELGVDLRVSYCTLDLFVVEREPL